MGFFYTFLSEEITAHDKGGGGGGEKEKDIFAKLPVTEFPWL